MDIGPQSPHPKHPEQPKHRLDAPPSMQCLVFLQRAAVLGLLIVGHAALAGNQVVKCVIDGRVTFQNTPCPVDRPTPRPTLEELNADRKKRVLEAQARAASEPKAGTPSPSPAMRTEPPVPDRAFSSPAARA